MADDFSRRRLVMTGKQLKNSILQWAIQGKLVPQDPNDEPASVLLEKIRAEKARLIKEGKIKKDKNESIIYRGEDNSYYEKFADGKVVCIDDEIPFEIPDGWEWCRLREVVFPPKYGTSNKSEVKGVMPVLRMGNIQDGEIIFDKLVFSNNEDDNQKYRLVCGDLLFNRTNSAELVGKTGIYRGQRPAIYAGYIILLRPICINSDYLNYILGSSYARSYCKEVKTIGVQQCNINADKISNFLIPIAPFSEQARIVQKLEEIANPLSKYQKNEIDKTALNKKLCDKLKKSILQEAIQGRLVAQDASEEPASVLLQRIKDEKLRLVKEGKLKKKDVIDCTIFRGDDNKYFEKKGKNIICIDEEIPFEIPESWQWCRVKQILDIGSARRVHQKDWRSSGIPFYRAREIGKLAECGHVDNELLVDHDLYKEFSSSGVPMPGDLMVTAVGTLGKVYIVKDGDLFYYKDGSVLCLNNRYNLNPSYLKYVIESPMFINQFVGESQGTTVATLTIVRFNEYLVPIPPLREQERIVKAIDNVASIMSR